MASGIESKNSIRRYPVVAVKMPILIARLPKQLKRTRGEYTEWWSRNTSPEGLAEGATRSPTAPERRPGSPKPSSTSTT